MDRIWRWGHESLGGEVVVRLEIARSCLVAGCEGRLPKQEQAGSSGSSMSGEGWKAAAEMCA